MNRLTAGWDRVGMIGTVILISLIAPCRAVGMGANDDTAGHAVGRIEIGLELSPGQSDSGRREIDARVTLKNTGEGDAQIQSLTNRLAVAFLVFDSLGNPVAPAGLGKIDPRTGWTSLKPGMVAKAFFKGLCFITGSARFGYPLRHGGRYTVVAVYRPGGPESGGICSRETAITLR